MTIWVLSLVYKLNIYIISCVYSTHFGVPVLCFLSRVQHGIRAGLSCFWFISSSKLILQVLPARPTGIDVVYNFAEGSFLKFCTDFETSSADCAAIWKSSFRFLFSMYLLIEIDFVGSTRETYRNRCGLQLCKRKFFQILHGFWDVVGRLSNYL